MTAAAPESKVVSFYDSVELSAHFLAKHTQKDRATIAHYQAQTLTLLELARSGHPFSPQEEQEWIDKILSGEIDADAGYHRIFVRADGTKKPHFPSLKIIPQFIEKAMSGAHILTALMDMANDPFGDSSKTAFTTLYQLAKRMDEMADGLFIHEVLSHPHIDINQPIDQQGNRFVGFCIPLPSPNPSLDDKTAQKEKAKSIALAKALECGAILSNHYYRHHKQLGMHQMLLSAPFAAYYETAHADWEKFKRGELAPESLSALQLGRFYSIGKLQEAMHPYRWRGHENTAFSLYIQLPQWIQHEYPCELELTSLIGCMSPASHISISTTSASRLVSPTTIEKEK